MICYIPNMTSEKVALTTMFVCIVLFFFSLALFPIAVSTYCSKRHVAAILIGIQVALGAWSSLRNKVSSNDRTLSLGAALFALFGIGLNFGFIIYATRLCRGLSV
jgi:hypothetical protein